MNNLFQENKRSLFLLLGMLFVLLIMVYFLFIRPLFEEREFAESEVTRLSSEVESLELMVEEMEEEGPVVETDIDHKRLEKRIPPEPELQEFLLTLQEFELVSGSKIEDYSFAYDGSLPERQAVESEEDTEEEVAIEGFEDMDEQEDEETNSVLTLPGRPENVQLVTVTMNLYSPDYEHFQTFLQEIEKQERIMMISYLSFDKPGEIDLLESDDESIQATIDVTTFYYED